MNIFHEKPFHAINSLRDARIYNKISPISNISPLSDIVYNL